jgi:hypothetical protein
VILSNFLNIDAVDNVPGYYRFWFIHESSVTYVPAVVNGVIDFEQITYAPGKDNWYIGGAYFDELELGEREQKSANGSLYPINIAGRTAGIQPSTLSLFHNMRNARFILIIADNNGNYFLCGEPNNGLIFDYSRESAYLKFTYKGNYTIPCWFLANYLGSDPTPDPGGGGTGGGLVTIKRADGTTISAVTAPADFVVNNTPVTLRDSAGNLISTTQIKAAAAAQDITAPDAVITLKDTAGATLNTTTAKSGESKNLTAPNANINVTDSQGTTISTTTAKSGESKNINIADAEVQLVNTVEYSIGDLGVKAAETKEIVIPDTQIRLVNSNDAIILNVDVPSAQPNDIAVSDVTIVLTNTADEAVATYNIAASTSRTEVIDDSNLTLNGAAWTAVKAAGSKDINLVDENDVAITPLVADDTHIKVQVFYSDSAIVRRAARYANLIITGNSNSIIR